MALAWRANLSAGTAVSVQVLRREKELHLLARRRHRDHCCCLCLCSVFRFLHKRRLTARAAVDAHV